MIWEILMALIAVLLIWSNSYFAYVNANRGKFGRFMMNIVGVALSAWALGFQSLKIGVALWA